MNDTFSPPDGLLVLPRLRVQNANAVSSPLTWGFPSPTAFLGFVHALERQLGSRSGVTFGGVGIVCHAFEAQTFRPNRRQHLVFTQSRNPVYLKRDIAKFIAEGTPAAIVEEGRAHLEVSLVVAANGYFEEARHEEAFAQAAYNLALGMRIAGGSVLPPTTHRAPQPEWVPWPAVQAERRKAFARLRRRLLPGFALIHRPDLLRERMAELQTCDANTSALDALLDLADGVLLIVDAQEGPMPQTRFVTQKAFAHGNIGDIRAPDLIGSGDGQSPQEIRVARMLWMRNTGFGLLVHRHQPHQAHKTPNAFSAHAIAQQTR